MRERMKNIIWTNNDINYDSSDWDLEDAAGESENERYERINDEISMQLDDEKENLDIELPEKILIIGDLGLWSGRVMGFRETNSCNIKDCLKSEYDYTTFFVDGHHNLRAEAIHHDGTNYYLYRMRKPGLSDSLWDNFLGKIYDQKAKDSDITRYTVALGPYIEKVYGWE